MEIFSEGNFGGRVVLASCQCGAKKIHGRVVLRWMEQNESGGITWFKSLWEYADHIGIQIVMQSDFCLHPICEGYRLLIDCFAEDEFDNKSLSCLSRFAHAKMSSISPILLSVIANILIYIWSIIP